MRHTFLSFIARTTVAAVLFLFALAAHANHMYLAVNMMDEEAILINVETDEIVIVPLGELPGWPDEQQVLQHAWITPDEKQLLISTDATPPGTASIVMLDLRSVDWKQGKADVSLRKIVKLGEPGSPAKFPEVSPVEGGFPIHDWTRPPYTQSHGPSFFPNTPFTYITHLQDNRIRGLNYVTGNLIETDPMSFGDASAQLHGITFNPAGTLALGVGYFYDNNQIDIYKANRKTGEIRYKAGALLGTPDEYAAFTHFVWWLDNRYAVTGTMQLGPTSLTESLSGEPATIIGPSVWLIDANKASATKIIGTAGSPDDPGVFRSASDVVVAKGKLYVAEEDSLAEEYPGDGYVAVYDFTDMHNPQFIKRLKPGVELPADFKLAHAMAVTLDENFVYVSSYVSKHIIKINTANDTVAKLYTEKEGLKMPHGEFISGRLR